MATIQSTTSSTVIALLGTISASAGAVAKTIDSASSSIDMLDRYVQRAKTRQIDTHKIEDMNWRRNLMLDAAKEQEKIETAIVREYSGDPSRAGKFNEILAGFESLFTETQS